jgi:hypothetical protein
VAKRSASSAANQRPRRSTPISGASGDTGSKDWRGQRLDGKGPEVVKIPTTFREGKLAANIRPGNVPSPVLPRPWRAGLLGRLRF